MLRHIKKLLQQQVEHQETMLGLPGPATSGGNNIIEVSHGPAFCRFKYPSTINEFFYNQEFILPTNTLQAHGSMIHTDEQY